LPMVQEINFKEYLYFVEKHNLFGKGIGYIDIHLLASAKLSQSKLWTLAKRLKSIALELGINYKKSR
ncbi:MAG: VapC toxin family PIN domain ribonuclease, partial [Deltaproteobacteria bacterium]|nr:VapC toxin family PIN domain ribonuclease [Deltaproteobacteria bacterium]